MAKEKQLVQSWYGVQSWGPVVLGLYSALDVAVACKLPCEACKMFSCGCMDVVAILL